MNALTCCTQALPRASIDFQKEPIRAVISSIAISIIGTVGASVFFTLISLAAVAAFYGTIAVVVLASGSGDKGPGKNGGSS